MCYDLYINTHNNTKITLHKYNFLAVELLCLCLLMHCVCHVYRHLRILWLSQAFLDFQKWMCSLKWGCFNARLGRGL